jgi:hypothetical protein
MLVMTPIVVIFLNFESQIIVEPTKLYTGDIPDWIKQQFKSRYNN